jgi:WD40 repeat protein
MSMRQLGSLLLVLPAALLVPRACGEPPATQKLDGSGDRLPHGALARMGTVRYRPGSRPFTLAVSPDSRTLATGEDGVVRLWDLATGKETRSFSFPDVFWIREVTFSPDGTRLAVVGDHQDSERWQDYKKSLFVFEAATGRTLYRFPDDAGGFGWLWFSPDGKVLAATQGGYTPFARACRMVFLEADTGKELRAIAEVSSAARSSNGKVVATGKWRFDGIHLWDLATGKELHCLPWGERGGVIALSPDGKTLAGATPGDASLPEGKKQDTSIHLWDVVTGKERPRLTGPWDSVTALAFSPDGTMLAGVDAESRVLVWEWVTGKLRGQVETKRDFFRCPFTFTPDGKRLFCCSAGAICEWDVVAGKETRRLGKSLGEIDQLLVTPDGKRLVSGGDVLGAWDLSSGKDLVPAGGHRTGVETALFSRDGCVLATRDQTQMLGLWDMASGRPVVTVLDGEKTRCVATGLSREGRELTALGTDAIVRNWDLTTGRSAGEFSIGGEATTRAWREAFGKMPYLEKDLDRVAALGPDARTLAVVCEGQSVSIWDTTTRKQLRRWKPAAPVMKMAFSPGGRYLSVLDEQRAIQLWDTKTSSDRPECRSQGDDTGCVFSGDDRFMAWSDGSQIHLRDLATGKETAQIKGVRDLFHEVAFLRGCQVFACWGKDHRLALWDVSKGALIRTVVAGLSGSRDTSFIATPDGGALAYYPVEVHRPVYALCDALTGREICQTRGWLDRFAVSPDGRLLAQGGSGIVLRELATGGEVGRVDEAHRGRVKTLGFSPDGRTLASTGWDGTILVWDCATLVGGSTSQQPPEAAWSDLAGQDAARAWKAIGALARSGDEAVSFLRKHLQPISAKEDERLRRWVADLDSDDFGTRESATRELASHRWETESALFDALLASPSAEARARIERLLSGPAASEWPSEVLRKSRAVCALERLGTPAAREFLAELSRGAPAARLTRQAKASLARLTGPGR